MITTNAHGYTVRWLQNWNSSISRIAYDGVDFLDVRVEFFNHSWLTKIAVVVLPASSVGSQMQPIMISGDFSAELLIELGIDVRDVSKISKDPERFVLNLMRITSDTGYWNTKLNNFLQKNYTMNKDSSYVLTDKDAKITELMEEISELKKELETMRAMMQEC
jgi:hypothetical protein